MAEEKPQGAAAEANIDLQSNMQKDSSPCLPLMWKDVTFIPALSSLITSLCTNLFPSMSTTNLHNYVIHLFQVTNTQKDTHLK